MTTAPLTIATITETTSLTVHNLICEFQYIPYIAKKRVFYKQTARGVVSQASTPLYAHGMQFLDWKITLTTRTTAALFKTLYDLDDTFTFTGYWGDEYLIDFNEPMVVTPFAGRFELSGKFRVLCVTSEFTPTDSCPVE